jgi:hypothetical protein
MRELFYQSHLFVSCFYDSILQKKDTVVDVTPDQIETPFDSTLVQISLPIIQS